MNLFYFDPDSGPEEPFGFDLDGDGFIDTPDKGSLFGFDFDGDGDIDLDDDFIGLAWLNSESEREKEAVAKALAKKKPRPANGARVGQDVAQQRSNARLQIHYHRQATQILLGPQSR